MSSPIYPNYRVTPDKVPVGTTTVAGYTVTATAASVAIIAFITGDRSAQTLGTLTASTVALVAFLITQIGRYAQAHAQIKAAGQEKVNKPAVPIGVATESIQAGDPVSVAAGFGSHVEPILPPPATVTRIADDDEPGDHFDAHPDIPVTVPEDIVADNVDAPPVEIRS